MEYRISAYAYGTFVREAGMLCASERLGQKIAGMYNIWCGVLSTISRHFLCIFRRAKTHKAYCKKYEPCILKYKALVLKYVPYIFVAKRGLIFSDLAKMPNNV